MTVPEMIFYAPPALILHEIAHVLCAFAIGLRIKKVGLSWKGPHIVREQGKPLENAVVSLAGPLINIINSVLFWRISPLFAQVNLILGLSNIMPFVPESDGQRAWKALRQLR